MVCVCLEGVVVIVKKMRKSKRRCRPCSLGWAPTYKDLCMYPLLFLINLSYKPCYRCHSVSVEENKNHKTVLFEQLDSELKLKKKGKAGQDPIKS